MAALSALFFVTELGGGGAESHVLRVMNHLERDRVRPTLAVCRRGGSYERFLKPDVDIHAVSIGRLPSALGRVLSAGPGLLRLTKRLRPDLVVSVMDLPNVVALATLKAFRSRPSLVACVQIPPSIQHGSSVVGRRIVLPGIRRLYPSADAVIALSHGVKGDLVELEARIEPRITVIHNACVDERIAAANDRADPSPVPEVPVILAAGRLAYQKGFPHLLTAFRRVLDSHPADLWILGEGPDRAALEKQIVDLQLANHVKLLGFQDNPQDYMRRATVFVLSSLYEGFGNVIVEAMACGLPVVSTDCPHGPSEIIEHERTGLLVPVADPPALAAAIKRVLDDEALRERLRTGGLERSRAFEASAVAARYADAFEHVHAERRAGR